MSGSYAAMSSRARGPLLAAVFSAILVLANPIAQGKPSHGELKLALRHEMLKQINRDRLRAGLAPVELDPVASEIADAYCRRQIQHRTTGHFTVDGQTPYMRYAFAGGNDGVSENAAAWSANYDFSDSQISELMTRSQQAMIDEKPPKDGHRRTILDPHATHVGIGVHWEGGEFRLAQEFIRRYVDWKSSVARVAQEGDETTVEGRVHDGYRLDAITVYRENFPRMLSAREASRIENYTFPKKRRDYLPQRSVAQQPKRRLPQLAALSRQKTFPAHVDGSFRFPLRFDDGPGVYTVVVWVVGKNDPTPIAASNISIRVIPPL